MRETLDQQPARPRRICFVLESAHLAFDSRPMIGGAEIQVRILAEKLASLGHEVSVASAEGFEHPRIQALDANRLLPAWRCIQPEVVVATVATRTAIRAAVVSRRLGIDFLYRLSHDCESRLETDRETGGSPLHRLVFFLMLKTLTRRIWCQHSGQRTSLEKRGLRGKLFVAANVAPDRRLASRPRETGPREAGPRETGPRETGPRETVLWIGRYHGVKRPQMFARIARRLPGRRFVMIVPGAPPEFRESLDAHDNLEVIDYVSPEDLPAYYADARVLVNTSKGEGLPNTFVEAACQGTPILTTDLDPGDFFRRYGHGEVVGDPVAAACRIEELFVDATAFDRLSANARRYFEEVHEIEHGFDRILTGIFE